LQPIWQAGGLSLILYIGSPESKEGDERKEAKLDLICLKIYPNEAEEFFKNLDFDTQGNKF
jgi:hypothetical protein